MTHRLYSHIIGLPIARKDDGEVLAKVLDVIVNPESGKIEALWIKETGTFGERKVLLTRDIIEWKLRIYVDSEVSFSEPEDIIRIKEILKKEIYIYLQKVKTVDDIYLGQVYDFNIDLISFQITNFYILKKFLFVSYDRRIINASEIIEIKKEAIIVRNDLRTVKWRKKKLIDLKELALPPEPEPT